MNLIFVNVVRLHGLPDDIVSDRGTPFISHFRKRLDSIFSASPPSYRRHSIHKQMGRRNAEIKF